MLYRKLVPIRVCFTDRKSSVIDDLNSSCDQINNDGVKSVHILSRKRSQQSANTGRSRTRSLLFSFGFICVSSFLGLFVTHTLAADNTVEKTNSSQGETAVPSEAQSDWTKNVDAQHFQEVEPEQGAKNISDLRGIATNVQSLKQEVIELNKDLRNMEEKLLFPSNTRYTVFLSLTTGQFFTLESVKLKIDGKLVATQIYSKKQRTALSRGGIHRLYVTNLNQGMHSATAFFTGLGKDGRPYKRAATLDFEKSAGSEFLELAIMDEGSTQEPRFELKRW